MAQCVSYGHLCHKSSLAGDPVAALPYAGVQQAQLGPTVPVPPSEKPKLKSEQVQVSDAQHCEPQTQYSQCVVHSSTRNLAWEIYAEACPLVCIAAVTGCHVSHRLKQS